jgi:hypothetical protein
MPLSNWFTAMFGLHPSTVCLVFHITWYVWMIIATTVGFFRLKKSEVHQHLVELAALAKTQFSSPTKCFQADNGIEFINTATTKFFAAQGTHLRYSCPYTSPQNGKAERIIRTLNNSIRTMLLHAPYPRILGQGTPDGLLPP